MYMYDEEERAEVIDQRYHQICSNVYFPNYKGSNATDTLRPPFEV